MFSANTPTVRGLEENPETGAGRNLRTGDPKGRGSLRHDRRNEPSFHFSTCTRKQSGDLTAFPFKDYRPVSTEPGTARPAIGFVFF